MQNEQKFPQKSWKSYASFHYLCTVKSILRFSYPAEVGAKRVELTCNCLINSIK